MNRLHFPQLLLALAFLLTVWILPAQELGIIPSPQHIEMRTGTYAFTGAPVVTTVMLPTFPVDTNADQGYILEVFSDKVQISAISEVGLYYGNLSLKQMSRYYTQKDGSVKLPCVRIVDYPKLKYRGWMDDISRGPIPNMTFLKQVIRQLAEYKMNFFNLYTEHVFKLDKYPDIAPTDGLTAEEIKELEEYAAQFHIEFFGNQQCLGHAEKTLRIPAYQEMADTKYNWHPGDEKARQFLKYELETVAKAYRSPFFNINCDETEAMGSGKARAYVENHGGPSQVYADHINWVYSILKPLGKRVMMWGDIAAKDPDIVRQLPKDMIMLVWSYSPSDSYVDMIEPFTKQGLQFMVVPGMSMWGHVFPSYDTYTKNIANLTRDGYKHGALGMMNTAWDDSGESLFNSTWHGMAWAAEMAWRPLEQTEPKAADKERLQRLAAFDKRFAKEYRVVDQNFRLMREMEYSTIPNIFNSLALYEPLLDFYPTKVSVENYQKNNEMCSTIRRRLEAYHEVTFDSVYDCHNAMARIGYYVAHHQWVLAQRNILRWHLYEYLQGNNVIDESSLKTEIYQLAEHIHRVKKMYMQLWDEECRPYSRNIVEARYDALIQELNDLPYKPFIEVKRSETGNTYVQLRTLFEDAPIYYTLDGRNPQKGENRYEKPVQLQESATVKALCRNEMGEDVLTEQYVLLHQGLNKISKLNSEYATYKPEYAAGGTQALSDGRLGGDRYNDGNWQGFWGNDIDVEFDFGKKTALHYFKTRFFQNVQDWIMSPKEVELYVSNDGSSYRLLTTLEVKDVNYDSGIPTIYTVQGDNLNIKARYVRVVVKNGGPLPEWHMSRGNQSYIFCDEMIFD
ncbi:MAG: chitobiase/beta-hexosaminidase C-terminal domain-containing protein [Bacteroidales bacterium]|nr:chitobiase/beta-hexosaminidase C-terminal domain-containing protein [Bacteroidales bacterium]